MKSIKFFRPFSIFFCFLFSVLSMAAELAVNPSSTEISIRENLSLEFKAVAEDYNADIGTPTFEAPDFDEVNVYMGMTGIESSFINGKISVKKTQSVTVVLHPKKKGKLVIRGIRVSIDGKVITSPDLVITVGDQPSGATLGGSPSYSYNSGNTGLPSQGVRPSKSGSSFFIKTETNKRKAYKGEQLILTYALYTQVPILGIQVERYPTVPGFLKEDLEIPLVQNRLQFSKSIVNGREYNRAVLAQYAIFPIKEGKLTIDALTGKFTYRTRTSRSGFDDDDAFGMLNQFLNSMQTSSTTSTSDRITIDVLPLPAAGQPKDFSGLVGDFDITAVADKYTLKTGEPLNVKVKIEGQGHAGSLEQLKIDWPEDFEMYEDKSSTQFSRTGHSERIFDYMLIPRAQGKFTIPAITLAMFNPNQGKYEVKRSQPIAIEVLEGEPGTNTASASTKSSESPKQAEPQKKEMRGWLENNITRQSPISWVFGALAFASAAFALGFMVVFRRKSRGVKKESRLLDRRQVEGRLLELQRLDQSPAEVLARVESLLGEVLLQRFGVSKGSLTRSELREVLIVHKASPEVAGEVELLIERCENFRFVPGGAQPQAARAVVESAGQLFTKILV